MESIANKSLTQVYEVLKHLSKFEYNKIPKEAFDIIIQNKDNSYIWKYDESKRLNEQNLNREAIAILSYINLEYLLSAEKRTLMEKIYEMNERKREERKHELYKTDELFKNKTTTSTSRNTKKQEANLATVKENVLTKFIKEIKRFFHIN